MKDLPQAKQSLAPRHSWHAAGGSGSGLKGGDPLTHQPGGPSLPSSLTSFPLYRICGVISGDRMCSQPRSHELLKMRLTLASLPCFPLGPVSYSMWTGRGQTPSRHSVLPNCGMELSCVSHGSPGQTLRPSFALDKSPGGDVI